MTTKTPEELLRPRYIVIADYPKAMFDTGDIIIPNRFDGIIDNHWVIQDPIDKRYQYIEVDKYPHLFRRLEWWEHRSSEDMPEYVKCAGKTTHDIDAGSVWKFRKLISNKPYQHSIMVYDNPSEFWANTFLPATLEEYTNYITTTHSLPGDNNKK